MAPLVAGAGARTIAVFAVAPLELMRTRQLAAQESGGSFMNTVSNSSAVFSVDRYCLPAYLLR